MLARLLSLSGRLLDGAERYETLIEAHSSQAVIGQWFRGLLDLAAQIQAALDRPEVARAKFDKLTLSALKALREKINWILANKPPVQTWAERLRPAIEALKLSECPSKSGERAISALMGPASVGMADNSDESESWFSAGGIAKRLGLPSEAVRKRLERFREKNKGHDGWKEVSDTGPREARYLYRLPAVRHLFPDSAG